MRTVLAIVSIALALSSYACAPQPTNQVPAVRDALVCRPGPDRRFLMAFTELTRVLTGKEAPQTIATYGDGTWLIQQGGATIGRLDDQAQYQPEMDLLIHWAKVVMHRGGLHIVHSNAQPYADRMLQAFMADYLMAAMQRIVPLPFPGVVDAETTCLQARALSLVCSQLMDDVQTADVIPAKALAAVALSRACDKNLPSEEALLMSVLGYVPEAVNAARFLPTDDPAALFILGKDSELLQFVARNKDNMEARYLYLYRLSSSKARSTWFSWERNHFTERNGHQLPIIRLAFAATGDSDLARQLADATLSQVENFNAASPPAQSASNSLFTQFASIANRPFTSKRPDALDSPGILNRFESYLAQIPENSAVNFFDPTVTTAFYRAYFYSALFNYGQPFLNNPETDAAREFLLELGDCNGGTGTQFQEWYAHLIVPAKNSDMPILLHDLTSTTAFGEPILMRTFEAIIYRSFKDPALRNQAARAFCQRADSRPANRADLKKIIS